MFRTFAMVLLGVFTSPAFGQGDPEYGEYLSSSCVTCHQAKASSGGIPSINGYDFDSFQQLMKLYRAKQLENPTMQTIAGRLTDEEIEALAAYFSALPEPE